MKEIKKIIAAYDKLKGTAENLALATVIKVEGSSYRRTGARMLIQENGIYTGGISGGCIEGDALRKAFLTLANNKARLVTYDTSLENEAQIGVSLGCQGVIHIIISPIDKLDNYNPVEQLIRCTEQRTGNVLMTVIEPPEGSQLVAGEVIKYSSASDLILQHPSLDNKLLVTDLNEVIINKKSLLKEYDSYKLFLEYIPPEVQIIIMGGNYDVYPLLKVCSTLGWHSVVVAKANRLDKKISKLANSIRPSFKEVKVDEFTVAIIMSHDYNVDLIHLKMALDSKLGYIGLLGPTKRKSDMLQELNETQRAEVDKRLYGPAGLDIGASQPEEIAISIVSEILSVMRDRSGSFLKDRKGPIYTR